MISPNSETQSSRDGERRHGSVAQAGALGKGRLLLYVFLGLAVFISYYPTHGNGFIDQFDDVHYVLENPAVRRGLTWEGIGWAFTTGHAANWHPLTWVSHMVDCSLYGMNPGGHHLTNLLLHVSNTLLLLVFLSSATGAFWRSALVACLFGLHPLHVESVAWISERKDVLCTFFFLLMLIGYRRYAGRPTFGRYTAVLILFVLGLLSKPMIVTAPFVLLLLDYWPLGRIRRDLRWSHASNLLLIVEKLPLLVLSAASCLITVQVQSAWHAVAPVGVVSVVSRLANALLAYVGYLGKMVWPVNLSVLYPYPAQFSAIAVVGASAIVTVLTILALLLRRRAPWFIVGWLWYLGTLVPVIGLVQVGSQAMADRYTYIPGIGIGLVVSWVVFTAARRSRLGRVALACGVAGVLTACSVLTWSQCGVWMDSESLFRHAILVTQNNYIAHNTYAVALMGRGQLDSAFAHFEEANRIRPNETRVLLNTGIVLEKMGRVDEAIDRYQHAIAVEPDSWRAFNNLGLAYARKNAVDSAIACYKRALEYNGGCWEARNNLGNALVRTGQLDEAIACFTEVISLEPLQPSPVLNRACALVSRGRVAEAKQDFERFISLQVGDHADRLYRVGMALDALGQPALAGEYFARAAVENPLYRAADSLNGARSAAPAAPCPSSSSEEAP